MEEAFLGSLIGLKLAIFITVLVFAYLADIPFKKNKNIHWLNLASIAFIVMAIAELLFVFGLTAEEHIVWQWVVNYDNLHLFIDSLYVVVGFSLICFMYSVNKNLKDYR